MTDRQDFDRELYAAAVGREKADYYLPKFARFAAGGGVLSWHWPAFFVSLFWLMYRKMWLWAALYFLVPIPVFMVLLMVSAVTSYQVYLAGTLIYWALIFLVFPVFANRLYYGHVRRNVALAGRSIGDRTRAVSYLAGAGGTSAAAVAVICGILAFMLLPVLGILAAIAIPAYQDYVMRARLSSAWTAARPAMTALEERIHSHSNLPESLAELAVAPDIAGEDWSARLAYSPADGAIRLEFTEPADRLAGKTLLLTPYLTADGAIVWRCSASAIEPEQLPRDCRSAE